MTPTSTPTVPSKRTVTDKAVAQGFRRLAKRLEVEYEKCCPLRPAGPEWFEQLDRVEEKLREMLAKRPLSRPEIQTTCDRAFNALKATLQKVKKTQPRTRECINMETGESHLIPDYA